MKLHCQLSIALMLSLFLIFFSSEALATGFGLVKIPVAPLREAPGHDAEMGTQAMLGTPVALDSIVGGEWWELTMPCGYHGFIHASSIAVLSDEQAHEWRDADRLFCIKNISEFSSLSGEPAGYAPYGGVVELTSSTGRGMFEVKLPNGQRALANDADFILLSELASRNPGETEIEQAIALALAARGAPYLWGGTTPLAPDCSGLTQVCMLSCGLLLPRNASQQAFEGVAVNSLEEAERGDLLFFTSSSGRVDHVAIYLGDGNLVQSSGIVYAASLTPGHPVLPYYRRKPAKICRIKGMSGRALRENPLLFNK